MRKTTRIQLELPQRAFERIKRLKDRTEAASYAEVVRAALIHYEGALEKGLVANVPQE